MHRTTVRRTAVAASALSLALLLGACGSGSSDAKDEKKSASPSNASAPDAKALSQAELDKLALTEADLENHKISEASKIELNAAKTTSSDKAECKPLVDALALRAGGSAAASTIRKVVALPKAADKGASVDEKALAGLDALKATITSATLGSYDGQGAVDTVAAVKKAGADCAGGFSLVVGADKTKFTKVAPVAFTAGDEAAAFTLTMDAEGKPITTHLVATRKGGTVATFFAMSLAGKAELPKTVVEAQMKKLG